MLNQDIKKVFRSRISVLILAFVLIVFIPSTIPMVKNMTTPGVYIMIGIFLSLILLLCSVRYIISGDKLYGKILWVIPSGSIKILDITSIERTYNPISSCAASLKRLVIKSRKGSGSPYILISPVREQEFIEDLKVINPDIYINVTNKKGIWRVQDWDI